jgi:AhpD family alkylhydroperoxidase
MPAPALQHVAWETCLLTPRRDNALESYARAKFGIPLPSIRYFVDVPWLARATVDLHPELGLLVHLDLPLGDLIQLAVSQENSCRFCYAAVRAMLRIQGMSEARIQRVESDLMRAELTPREVAAIAFARAQSRSSLSAAAKARQALLDTGVSHAEMKEVAFVTAMVDFLNRASTIPAIPPYGIETAPEQLHVRLLRPWIARALRSHRHRGQATPLGAVPSYPYARLVEAFAGSPIAPALGKTLAEMWASPSLTLRCKLLLFAVIARGLGCEVCEREAARALQTEGLSETDVTNVLTHLDAPGLDPVERLLVPFARETIWYEPAPLQRRARMVRDQLSGTQFLEAVGVLALANGLCRLGAMVAGHP